jgi:anti-sigma B factor antagonist
MAGVQPAPFSVTVRRDRGRAVLCPTGELDCVAAPILETCLQEVLAGEGAHDVVIDLAQMVFIDSRGLGALITASRMAKESGRDLALSGASPQALKAFQITGLAEHFTFVSIEPLKGTDAASG